MSGIIERVDMDTWGKSSRDRAKQVPRPEGMLGVLQEGQGGQCDESTLSKGQGNERGEQMRSER